MEWSGGPARTALSDATFREAIMENLMDTQERLSKHFWIQATYGIRNQDGTNGLAVHNDGIIGAGIPFNEDLIAWWCRFSVNHGYGIFHDARQDNMDWTLV